MQNMNKLALKAGSWYIISNFILKGIAIFTTPIFTRLLSPNDFGITNTYSSWLGIITIIGTLDIYSCVQIARYDYTEEEMKPFLSSILTMSSLSLVGLYAFVRIAGVFAPDFIGLPSGLIDIMFIEILFVNAFTIMQTKNKAYFKYKQFVLFSAIIAVASPVLAIILIASHDSNLYFWKVFGNAIPKILIACYLYFSIMREGKEYFSLRNWKYALVISVPLIPHHLAGNLLNHFDKIMITKFVDSAATGLYSLGYNYALILSIAWASFNQAWVPWFYGKMNEEKPDEIKKIVKPYAVLFSLIFISMLCIGPEAIRMLGPKEYWGSKWILPPVLLGIYFQFLYSLYANVEFFLKKTQFIAIGTMAAAALNIVLNYIFIPKFGYIAAAYTTLFGYAMLFILHFLIARKWFDTSKLFESKFIFLLVIIMSAITIGVAIFYDKAIIRYSMILTTYVLVLIKYKSTLVLSIKMITRRS